MTGIYFNKDGSRLYPSSANYFDMSASSRDQFDKDNKKENPSFPPFNPIILPDFKPEPFNPSKLNLESITPPIISFPKLERPKFKP
jgi:hypothetical protein